MLGEYTSGRYNNSIYALKVSVTEDLQKQLPISPYDTAAMTNPDDMGLTDTLYCLKQTLQKALTNNQTLCTVYWVWKIKEQSFYGFK